MSSDARQKLRDMGGIMASSPDLMQAVQRFQVGGPVMNMPPMPPSGPNFAPRTPPAPMAGIRPSMPSFVASDAPLPSAKPPRATRLGDRVFILTDDNRVLDAETNTPAPPRLAEEVRRKLGVSDVVPEYREAGPLTYGGGASPMPSTPDMPFERRVPRGIEGGLDQQAFVSRGAQSAAQGREETFPSLLTEEPDGPTIDSLLDISAMGGINMGALNTSLNRNRGIPRSREQDVPVEEDTPVEEETEMSPEETVMAQPLVPESLTKEQADKALELANDDPNISPPPGGGKPAKRDLRSRYKEQLALMQEIYGLDDEDEARDRAMSLAMIGLAIAAGQSPNALTNIAQGAMVGLQAMGDRQAEAEDRQRGIKTLALETAIEQQAAEAGAEADAAKLDLEQRNELELEEFKARVGAMYGGAGGARDARNIIDFTQNTYGEALKAASAMTAPDFDPDVETPHQYAMRQAEAASSAFGKMFPGYGGNVSDAAPEIPTITTRAEYDALPSGTKFMQNGQERIKP